MAVSKSGKPSVIMYRIYDNSTRIKMLIGGNSQNIKVFLGFHRAFRDLPESSLKSGEHSSFQRMTHRR